MACGAGCMGGPKHKTRKCTRFKTIQTKRKANQELEGPSKKCDTVQKNEFIFQTRENQKRWRLLTAPSNKAEIWALKTFHPDGVPTEISIMVGPAFPGTLFPVQGLLEKGSDIKVVAKTRVKIHGVGFVPADKPVWGSINTNVWKKCAESSCAWGRFTTKAVLHPKDAKCTVEDHVQLFFDEEEPMVAQLPPATIKRNNIVRCAYCGTAYPSIEKYAEKCAPDATAFICNN